MPASADAADAPPAEATLEVLGAGPSPGPDAPPALGASSPGVAPRGLTERQRAVLEMERRHHGHRGVKEQAVREELDLSATRYHQVLNALLDDPVALAHDPVLVGRLRRLRDQRTAGAAT